MPASAVMRSKVTEYLPRGRRKAKARLGVQHPSHLPRSRPSRLTFTAFGAKAKVVALASVTVLAGDAWLALALPCSDVTLPVGGAQRVAVAPGGSRCTSDVTQKGHMGQVPL